jgi:hypothetical protein
VLRLSDEWRGTDPGVLPYRVFEVIDGKIEETNRIGQQAEETGNRTSKCGREADYDKVGCSGQDDFVKGPSALLVVEGSCELR